MKPHPEVSYIAVSGYIYDTNNLLQEMNPNVNTSNWLCTHGTSDGVLPFDTSQEQVNTLQNGGFDITFKSYDKDHNVVEDELMMIKE